MLRMTEAIDGRPTGAASRTGRTLHSVAPRLSTTGGRVEDFDTPAALTAASAGGRVVLRTTAMRARG